MNQVGRSLVVLVMLASPSPSFAQAAPIENYHVILQADLAGSAYEEAAQELARFRQGELWRWDGDWEALERRLLTSKPTWLALVLSPQTIDANLPRRLIPVLARLDQDPFVDCAFGLITGGTGEEALGFVRNIRKASKADLPLRRFETVSVVLEECRQLGPQTASGPVKRPMDSTTLWMTGQDPDWRDFLASHRDGASGRGLIEWGHCGDSQGIWLFGMGRNAEPDKHWDYEPDKVGWDPDGEMPRLKPADLLEGVDLFPAVVVNGSCHSAVTHHTFVGGDIVSTFGRTHGVVRFHPIPPEESFPLAAIAHGATAYIAPLAANNANRAAIEMWMIREGGTRLGEVMKRTYDELIMGTRDGLVEFALFEDGQPEQWQTPMFHDTFHRVLFGDPAFLPWREPVQTTHQLTSEWDDQRLRVTLDWAPVMGDPWIWDPWLEERDPRGERARMYTRVLLEDKPNGRPVAQVLAATAQRNGEAVDLALEATARLESDLYGRPILHLKASGSRTAMNPYGMDAPEALHAAIEVRFVR